MADTAVYSSSMPLPPTPGKERPTTSRTKSRLSFGSHKSSGSVPKIDLTETPKEKARQHLGQGSKADPSAAIREVQPALRSELEKSTLGDLRSMQHVDSQGNPITDPDRTNPTRPRMERPLDTIRSFEAAIDGSYAKRFSVMVKPDGSTARHDSMGGQMRRNSSYAQGPYTSGPYAGTGYGYGSGHGQGSGPRNAYPGPGPGPGYGGRRMGSRPESYVENFRNSPAPMRDDSRRAFPRNHSDPTLYGNNAHMMHGGGYPNPNAQHYIGSQRPYDTLTTASASGTSHNTGTDAWNSSTQPSSENSSIDRIPQTGQPVSKPSQLQMAQAHSPTAPTAKQSDLAEAYGFNGFGGAPDLQPAIIEESATNGIAGKIDGGYGQEAYQGTLQQAGTRYPHGPAGFNGGSSRSGQPPSFSNGGRQSSYYQMPQQPANTAYGKMMPPPPPPHGGPVGGGNGSGDRSSRLMPRLPAKLQSAKSSNRMSTAPMTSATNDYGMPAVPDKTEKRKSWLARTFSRSK